MINWIPISGDTQLPKLGERVLTFAPGEVYGQLDYRLAILRFEELAGHLWFRGDNMVYCVTDGSNRVTHYARLSDINLPEQEPEEQPAGSTSSVTYDFKAGRVIVTRPDGGVREFSWPWPAKPKEGVPTPEELFVDFFLWVTMQSASQAHPNGYI